MERRNIETMTGETLIEILNSVRRHKLTAILTFLGVTGFLTVLILVWPDRYVSDGLMYVRLGRGAVSVDPSAQSSKTVSLMESRETEVNSVARMLESREIAERAVRKLGAKEINRKRNWVEDTIDFASTLIPRLGGDDDDAGTMTAEEYEAQVELEEAVERIQDWVGISVPKDSHTVAIFGKGTDPMLAQSIVQALMDEYKSFHVEAHRASGSLEFFEQQVAESREKALQAREALEKTKSEMGWLSIAASEETLRARITELEALRVANEAKCAEAESHAEALQSRLADVKEWIPTETTKGIATKSGEDMRTQLFGLQVEGSEAIAKYKPGHPRYRLIKEMMSQSEDILADEGKEREHSTEALNPVYQGIQGELEATSARAIGLKSGCQALEKSLEVAKEDLRRLNQDAITLSKLKWDSDIAEQNYLKHSASFEEARVAAALDNQEVTDVSVIQDASLNVKKAGPPRLMILVMALALGFLTSVLAAIAKDSFKRMPTVSYEPSVRELLEKTEIKEPVRS